MDVVKLIKPAQIVISFTEIVWLTIKPRTWRGINCKFSFLLQHKWKFDMANYKKKSIKSGTLEMIRK